MSSGKSSPSTLPWSTGGVAAGADVGTGSGVGMGVGAGADAMGPAAGGTGVGTTAEVAQAATARRAIVASEEGCASRGQGEPLAIVAMWASRGHLYDA